MFTKKLFTRILALVLTFILIIPMDAHYVFAGTGDAGAAATGGEPNIVDVVVVDSDSGGADTGDPGSSGDDSDDGTTDTGDPDAGDPDDTDTDDKDSDDDTDTDAKDTDDKKDDDTDVPHTTEPASNIILNFTPLDDDVAFQSVPYASEVEDILLPETLTALILSVDTHTQDTDEIEVTWVSEPDFDAYEPGEYIFTAVIDEDFELEENPPVITVTVEEATGLMNIMPLSGNLMAEWRYTATPPAFAPVAATGGTFQAASGLSTAGGLATANWSAATTRYGINSGGNFAPGTNPNAHWLFTTSSTDYSNISITLGMTSSASGPRDFTVEYATVATPSASDWHPATTVGAINIIAGFSSTANQNFATLPAHQRTVNLPAGANDKAVLLIRLRHVGGANDSAGGAGATIAGTGANTINNIEINGTYTVPGGTVTPPAATGYPTGTADATIAPSESITLTAAAGTTIYYTIDNSLATKSAPFSGLSPVTISYADLIAADPSFNNKNGRIEINAIADDGVNESADVTFVYHNRNMTVGKAISMGAGTIFTVEGIMVYNAINDSGNNNGTYLQDDTAGIAVRPSGQANINTVAGMVGREVRITGASSPYQGLPQVVPTSTTTPNIVELNPSPVMPTPISATVEDVRINSNPFMMVSLTDLEIVSFGSGTGTAQRTYTVRQSGGTPINLVGPASMVTEYSVGGLINVTKGMSTRMNDAPAIYVTTGNIAASGNAQEPTADIANHSYVNDGSLLTLTSPTVGATIYYTTNGSNPTTSSSSIASGATIPLNFGVSDTITVKAMAVLSSSESNTVEFTYRKRISALVGSIATWAAFSGSGEAYSIGAASGKAHSDSVITVGDDIRGNATGTWGQFTWGTGTAASSIYTAGWSSTNADAYWEITTNTKGFKNIDITFGTYSTSAGPSAMKAMVSTDGGTTFVDFPGNTYTVPTDNTIGNAQVKTIALPNTANDINVVKIRLFATATGSGNNRLTSMAINGEELPVAGVVSPPVANPPGGSHVADNSLVTLTTPTTGAEIWYTTDGITEPDKDVGTQYITGTPITLTFTGSTPITIKAIAVKTGETSSAVVSFTYYNDILSNTDTPGSRTLAIWDFPSSSSDNLTLPYLATGGIMMNQSDFNLSPGHPGDNLTFTANTGTTGISTLYVNGWDGNPSSKYFELKTSSLGYDGLNIAWGQYGTATAPRAWELQYAVGENPPDIAFARMFLYNLTAPTISNTVPIPRFGIDLPDDAKNQEHLTLRLRPIATGNTANAINGGAIAPTGNVRMANIVITGNPYSSIPIVIATPESSAVAAGTEVAFTTNKPGLEIWYTTDGSNPQSSPTRTKYTVPIPINAATTFETIAIDPADAGFKSEITTFTYTIRSGGRDVVIYELYPGGGNSGATYNRKYIVLKNVSSTPVNIGGWSVRYAGQNVNFPTTGTSVHTIALNTVIPANGFLPIILGSGANGSSIPAHVINSSRADALPAQFSDITPAASNGKMVLTLPGNLPITGTGSFDYTANPHVVDIVGYGAGNTWSGAGAALGPSNNTQSLLRNTLITGNNNQDFRRVNAEAEGANTYLLDGDLVSNPRATFLSGQVFAGTKVAFTALNALNQVNAEIWYTTDGSVPGKNNGTLYTSPITINEAVNFRVVAVSLKNPAVSSAVMSFNYTIRPVTVVIHELYVGGGNSGALYNHKYAVLKNMTDAPIEMNGWTLRYAAANGSFTTSGNNVIRIEDLNIPDNTIIPANGYMPIIFNDTAGNSGEALPSHIRNNTRPDVVSKAFIGNMNPSASSGKFILTSSDAAVNSSTQAHVVDMVGYGSANMWSGLQAVPEMTENALTMLRKNIITGNNNEDFNQAVVTTAANVYLFDPNATYYVPEPRANPGEGAVLEGTQLTFTTHPSDSHIFYTDDGTDPIPGVSTRFQVGSPITINSDITFKVIAVEPNNYENKSKIVTFSYTLREMKVVIHELYPGGGNANATYDKKYLVLRNTTDDPQNVGGWELRYTSSASIPTSGWTIPTSTPPIPAQGYLPIILNSGTAGSSGDPLPSHISNKVLPYALDAITSSINPSGTTGTVMLISPGSGTVSSTADIRMADIIGYGDTSLFGGYGAAPGPNTSVSLLRMPKITGSNNEDFDIFDVELYGANEYLSNRVGFLTPSIANYSVVDNGERVIFTSDKPTSGISYEFYDISDVPAAVWKAVPVEGIEIIGAPRETKTYHVRGTADAAGFLPSTTFVATYTITPDVLFIAEARVSTLTSIRTKGKVTSAASAAGGRSIVTIQDHTGAIMAEIPGTASVGQHISIASSTRSTRAGALILTGVTLETNNDAYDFPVSFPFSITDFFDPAMVSRYESMLVEVSNIQHFMNNEFIDVSGKRITIDGNLGTLTPGNWYQIKGALIRNGNESVLRSAPMFVTELEVKDLPNMGTDFVVAGWTVGGGQNPNAGDTLKATIGENMAGSSLIATGGADFNGGTLTAFISASNHRSGGYFLFTVDTRGFTNLRVSIPYRASVNGHQIIAQYSTDLSNPNGWQSIPGTENASVSWTGNPLNDEGISYALLPNVMDNKEAVYIRVYARAFGSGTGDGGNVAGTFGFNNVRIVGDEIPDDGLVNADPFTGRVPLEQPIILSNPANRPMEYRVVGAMTNFAAYTAPIEIDSFPFEIEARTTSGNVRTRTFRYTQSQVAAAIARPLSPQVPAGQVITFNTATPNATIRYFITTKVGTSGQVIDKGPGDEGLIYDPSDPIVLTTDMFPVSIEAWGEREKWLDSSRVTFNYSMRAEAGGEMTAYYGQLHAHTGQYSDGKGQLSEALNHLFGLKESRSGTRENYIDFFAFTDHSDQFDGQHVGGLHYGPVNGSGERDPSELNVDAMTDSELMNPDAKNRWETYKNDIKDFTAANQSTGLIVMAGYEMTWSGGPGHMNTFNTPGLVSRNAPALNVKANDGGLRLYYEKLKNVPLSVSQFNHPGTTFGTFGKFAYWEPEIGALVTMIEVGNGEGNIGTGGYFPSFEYFTQALDKGWQVAPTNNQDNHQMTWGNANTARTVIYTDVFTEDGLYDGMRNRRMYATENKHLDIKYWLNDGDEDHIMGSVLGYNGENVTIKAEIHNKDPRGSGIGVVDVVTSGGRVVETFNFGSSNYEKIEWDVKNDYSYYFLRVRQPDQTRSVTAPVWVAPTAKVGSNDMQKVTPVAYVGGEVAINTSLYNLEPYMFNMNSMKYSVILSNGDDETIIPIIEHTTLPNLRPGTTDATYQMRFSPMHKGEITVMVEVEGTLNGVKQSFEDRVTFEVFGAGDGIYVGIDGSHFNEYVSGHNKNEMNNIVRIAQGVGVHVDILMTKEDLINAARNNVPGRDYRTLIFTPPSRRDGSTGRRNFKDYDDDVLAAVAAFSQQGGTVVVTGMSSANENYGNLASIISGRHMSVQQNKLLAEMGSTLRVGGDRVNELDSNHQGSTNSFNPETSKSNAIMLLNNERGTYNWSNPYLAGGLREQIYRQFGGSSVYTVAPADRIHHDAPISQTIPETVIPGVIAADTGVSVNGAPNLGSNHNFRGGYTRFNNRIIVMASETVTHDNGNTSQVIVSGAVFMSDHEVQPGHFDTGASNFMNHTILTNILSVARETVSPIQAIWDAEREGLRYTVEGIMMTDSMYLLGGTEKAFFDSGYLQDETGGINLYPVLANNLKMGQKVRVSGFVDSYQGERQLKVTRMSLVDGNVTEERMAFVNNAQPFTVGQMVQNTDHRGRFVEIKGRVKSIGGGGSSLINQIVIEDGGYEFPIAIDGYITRDRDAALQEQVKVGGFISAKGFSSVELGYPRLRVRDRDEIKSIAPYPIIESITPNDNNAPVNGDIKIVYSEVMDPSKGEITLNKTRLTGGNWTDARTYVIPYTGLSYSTEYTIGIKGFESQAGVPVADSESNFTTVSSGGASTPTVISVYPNDSSAPLDGTISINFSERMDEAVIGRVLLNDKALEGVGTWFNGLNYQIPYSGLSPGTKYTVTIEGFANPATVTMLPDSTHYFITLGSEGEVGSGISGNEHPGSDSQSASQPVNNPTTNGKISVNKDGKGSPTTVVVEIDGRVNDKNDLSFTITGAMADRAIKAAMAEIKKLARTDKSVEEDGIEIFFKINADENVDSMSARIQKRALDLLSEAVMGIHIDTKSFFVEIDSLALQEMNTQTKGMTLLAAGPVNKNIRERFKDIVADRPFIEFTASNEQRKIITNIEGEVLFGIPYETAADEKAEGLSLLQRNNRTMKLNEDAKYTNKWMYWEGQFNNAFGIGYDEDKVQLTIEEVIAIKEEDEE